MFQVICNEMVATHRLVKPCAISLIVVNLPHLGPIVTLCSLPAMMSVWSSKLPQSVLSMPCQCHSPGTQGEAGQHCLFCSQKITHKHVPCTGTLQRGRLW